jgi:YD repeat-containing protein
LTIQDDETPGQAKDSYANFISSDHSIKENNTEWHQIMTHVSESPTVNGSIVFQAQSEKAVYGIHYITEPSFTDDKLTLPAVPGTNTVSFKVLTLNNDFISSDLEITFTIYQTMGNIKKGSSVAEGFKVFDDELAGMPKGYETSGGGWGMKKTYEYNTKGNIARVVSETYTPYPSTDIYTYYYNDAGQLIRINTDPGHDIIYYWENARIVKQDQIRDGVIRSYSEYGYDDHGNVASYRTFYLQPDGSFSLSTTTLLLYHVDDNLYKKIIYLATSNPEHEVIISETTFDNYLDEENPFPMVEVLPNMKTQKSLPGSYRVNTNGQDLLYTFSYEFRLDGKVGKRTATRGNTSDVAVYHYY